MRGTWCVVREVTGTLVECHDARRTTHDAPSDTVRSSMRPCAVCQLFGILLLVLGCTPPVPRTAEILTACPADVPGCVVMSLDAPHLDSILLRRAPAPGIQRASFTMGVPVRTESGARGSAELSLVSFVDGQDCDAFGQAEAAVVGFTASQEPVLLTSAGPLIVEGGTLVAGCPTCARLATRTGEPAGAAAVLPDWDLSLVRIAWGTVSYRDDGQLLVPQDGRCVAIPRAGRVAAVSIDECVKPEAVPTPSGAPNRGPEYSPPRYYSAPGRTHLLVLETGACT